MSLRRIVWIGALVAVVGAVAGIAYHRTAADPYRAEAAALALAIGCADFQPAAVSGAAHEQGTCHLDGTRVTVATFDGAKQQRAYSHRLTTLLPRFTHRGGAYAEGDGWAVVDGAALSRHVATQVVGRVGGTVREVTAPATS